MRKLLFLLVFFLASNAFADRWYFTNGSSSTVIVDARFLDFGGQAWFGLNRSVAPGETIYHDGAFKLQWGNVVAGVRTPFDYTASYSQLSYTYPGPPSTDQTVTIEGSFMSPEQWEASKITSANLQLWVKSSGGEWQMVSEIESSDGSYSWEFESETSFDYEIRLGDYVVDLGDNLPSFTLPGGEVLGNGTYTQPSSNPPATVSISSNGTTSLGGSVPVQSGSTVSPPSSPGGSPSVQPIYTVPGTNGTTHYVNTGTGQVTSYSSGSPSAGTQNAVAQQNLSDIVGNASFPPISGNYTVPSVPDGLGEETVSQGQAIATMAESARGGLVAAIGNVPSPNMPSFGSALSWSATIPYLGAISFDLSPHSGIINAWREFLKFLLAILAWIWTIQIIRGSTA